MGYSLAWRQETEEDLRGFSQKHRKAIIRKVRKVVENLPGSLKLRTVQPIKGADELGLPGRFFEIDIGSGFRAAIVVDDDTRSVVVYLTGDHDYCKANYLRAAAKRLGE